MGAEERGTPGGGAEGAPAKDAGGEPVWLKVLEQVVSLVRALVWPCLVVLLLIVFHGPIREVAEQMPDLVSRTQKISGGGLSMEIQAQARKTGVSGLAAVLRQLDPGDVTELIHKGWGPWGLVGPGINEREWFLPSEREMASLKRLVAAGLLELMMDRRSPSDGTRETISFDEFAARMRAAGIKPVESASGESSQLQLPPGPVSEEAWRVRSTQYRPTPLGTEASASILKAITAELAAAGGTERAGSAEGQ